MRPDSSTRSSSGDGSGDGVCLLPAVRTAVRIEDHSLVRVKLGLESDATVGHGSLASMFRTRWTSRTAGGFASVTEGRTGAGSRLTTIRTASIMLIEMAGERSPVLHSLWGRDDFLDQTTVGFGI
jgi:hypothetical protein